MPDSGALLLEENSNCIADDCAKISNVELKQESDSQICTQQKEPQTVQSDSDDSHKELECKSPAKCQTEIEGKAVARPTTIACNVSNNNCSDASSALLSKNKHIPDSIKISDNGRNSSPDNGGNSDNSSPSEISDSVISSEVPITPPNSPIKSKPHNTETYNTSTAAIASAQIPQTAHSVKHKHKKSVRSGSPKQQESLQHEHRSGTNTTQTRQHRKSSHRTYAPLMPPPPISPSALTATDRDEEMAGFVQRLRLQQEQNGVCDATTKNESGNHDCPILWRTRSLNAPSPIQQFGPCGRIMRNSAMVMTIQDPASQRLTWYKPPLSVLVIKKVRDAMVIPPFLQLVTWLTQEKRMVVFVEASVLDDRLVTGHAMFPAVKDKLMSFRETHDDLTDKIDFIICLGGDGTLLYASSLFQQSVPPVMAFHLGSLGFLTPFRFNNYQEQVNNVLEGHAALTLRSRLRCIILRRGQEKQLPPSHQPAFNDKSNNNNNSSNPATATTAQAPTIKSPTNLLVLNEVVIDRGPSPFLSNLDLYLDGKRITSVQGDGLIVSTPTGSTAYAVAAGASMIHPSVPAIMVTPICPHSLSFRPIVVPAGVELKVKLNSAARNSCWVSFDGRHQTELVVGDSLRVTTSIYPVPSICAEDQIADWFASLDECLRWNDRKRQRHLDDYSPSIDDAANNSETSSPGSSLPTTPTATTPVSSALQGFIEKEGPPDSGGLQSVLEKRETEEEDEEADQQQQENQ